jgi:hypothetical protein
VLVLLALKWISEIVQNPAIFRNALIAVVVAIVGVAVGAVVGGVGVFSVLTGVGAGGPNGMDFARLFTTIVIALVVVWLFAVVSAGLLQKGPKPYRRPSKRKKCFRTAGLLVLIGAVLTIVIVGAGNIAGSKHSARCSFLPNTRRPSTAATRLRPHPKTSVKASISEPAKPLCLTHTATGSSSSGSPSNASPASVTSMSSRAAGLWKILAPNLLEEHGVLFDKFYAWV